MTTRACQTCLQLIVDGVGHDRTCEHWRPVGTRRIKCKITASHNGHGSCPGIDFKNKTTTRRKS